MSSLRLPGKFSPLCFLDWSHCSRTGCQPGHICGNNDERVRSSLCFPCSLPPANRQVSGSIFILLGNFPLLIFFPCSIWFLRGGVIQIIGQSLWGRLINDFRCHRITMVVFEWPTREGRAPNFNDIETQHSFPSQLHSFQWLV